MRSVAAAVAQTRLGAGDGTPPFVAPLRLDRQPAATPRAVGWPAQGKQACAGGWDEYPDRGENPALVLHWDPGGDGGGRPVRAGA